MGAWVEVGQYVPHALLRVVVVWQNAPYSTGHESRTLQVQEARLSKASKMSPAEIVELLAEVQDSREDTFESARKRYPFACC